MQRRYIALCSPCSKHYRTFRGLLPSTRLERLSYSVKFKHHAIVMPNLTPADEILEVARKLDSVIKQQPKQASMDEITTIELLQKVLTGEQTERVALNSLQKAYQTKIFRNLFGKYRKQWLGVYWGMFMPFWPFWPPNQLQTSLTWQWH